MAETVITMRVDGIRQVEARILRVVLGVGRQVDTITEKNAHRLVDEIKQEIRSQGLVDTGAYLNSWVATYLGRGIWAVTTDAPQSDRLEYGFVATDAAGRSYATPPRPHRRPATERVRKQYAEDLGKVVPSLWRR